MDSRSSVHAGYECLQLIQKLCVLSPQTKNSMTPHPSLLSYSLEMYSEVGTRISQSRGHHSKPPSQRLSFVERKLDMFTDVVQSRFGKTMWKVPDIPSALGTQSNRYKDFLGF